MADDSSIPRGRLKRLGRMAGLAAQVGGGLAKERLRRLLGQEKEEGASESGLGASGPALLAHKALETLGTLKGAALKAGQTLSLFADQLPPDARLVLGRLFHQAPTLPYADIARVVEAELGAPPEHLFASFDEVPFAAASLGQVHGARLHGGEAVAVKVQYPGVAEAMEDDLRNLSSLLESIGMGGLLMDGQAYAQEVRRELLAELDYRRELATLERFRGLLGAWEGLVVPGAFAELCTGRVLVLERLEGPTLGQLVERGAEVGPEERALRGEQLVRAVLGPWLRFGVVHADTHPGNYLALPDGRLGVLDFGSVKEGSEPFWRGSREALEALVMGRSVDWRTLHERAGFRLSLSEEKARRVLEDILAIIVEPLRGGVHDFGQDTTLQQLAQLKLRYPLDLVRIQPPAESLLVGRAMGGLLQNLRKLEARFDLGALLRRELEVAPAPGGRGD